MKTEVSKQNFGNVVELGSVPQFRLSEKLVFVW